jgi:hypothetical protein
MIRMTSNDLHRLPFYKLNAGKTGTELPPGTNAFKGLSELIPPKYSSEFMNS